MVGAPHPDERLEVTIRIRSRAGQQLTAHVQSLAAPTADTGGVQPHLSREEFAERFGADPADIAKVTDFATQAGLTVVDASAPGYPTIMVSAGKRGLQVELAPSDLIAQCRATVADIAAG